MAAPYLSELRETLETLPDTAGTVIECRHFFSGAAAYAGGQIFMSLSPAGLALKLPPEVCLKLIDQGAAPLQYFAASPVKKDYVVLPESLATDAKALGPLVGEAIRFAATGSQ